MAKSHFAVSVCVYPRRLDPFYHIAEMNSIASIVDQTYEHWTLVVGGDALDEMQLARVRDMLERSVPPGRWFLTNTRASHAERNNLHLYNDDPSKLWFYGGGGCVEHVSEYVKRLPAVTHFSHLDDDDFWYPNHLALHALAYMQVPHSAFVYSVGKVYPIGIRPPLRFMEGTPVFPWSGNSTLLRLHPPIPCYIFPSLTSYRLDYSVADIGVRFFAEQRLLGHRRGRHWSPFRRCSFYIDGVKQGFMAGDMDAYDRVWDMVEDGKLVSVGVTNITVWHSSTAYKKGYLSLFWQSYCTPSLAKAAQRWRFTSMHDSPFVKRLLSGREARLRKLFWPQGQGSARREWNQTEMDALWRPKGAGAVALTWRPHIILDHEDYMASLVAYRAVTDWMHVGEVPDARSETLHIIRPLLDLACGPGESCVFVELGDYCGSSLALALTFPRLGLAVNIGRTALAQRGCQDLLLESLDFRANPEEYRESVDYTAPKMEQELHSTKTHTYFLDARDVKLSHEAKLRHRLHCIAMDSNASVVLVQPQQPLVRSLKRELESKLGNKQIHVLVLGASSVVKNTSIAEQELLAEFRQLSPRVPVGGVVVFDHYHTNPVVKRAIYGFLGDRGLHSHRRTRYPGLIESACITDFNCLGSLGNFAHARSEKRAEMETANGQHVSDSPDAARKRMTESWLKYSNAFLMQRVAVGRPPRGDCSPRSANATSWCAARPTQPARAEPSEPVEDDQEPSATPPRVAQD